MLQMNLCRDSYLQGQEVSSCWDGRPFGHNRHGPKSEGLLYPFRRGGKGRAESHLTI